MNPYDISEFPIEVITELQYYVYRLIDPRNGETFYIGKGKSNRVFQHIKCEIDLDEDDISQKLQVIRAIKNAGLNVIHVIHRHGMSEDVALEVEAALIDAFPGISNSQGGTGSNDYGPMNAIELINKYKAEEVIFNHKALMIIINKTITQDSIYNATRFAWKISIEKAKKTEIVLAVCQGIVVGVFIADEWLQATIANFPEFHQDRKNRVAFNGHEAPESVQQQYMRKRIPDIYRKKGAANPIKYSF